MLATAALFPLLSVLGAVTALPTDTNYSKRADGVSVGSQLAPDADQIYEVGSIIVGDRGKRQDWDLAGNKNCVISAWGGRNKEDGGWDAYVYCIRATKPVVWDIRRIGQPTRCDLGDVTQTWVVSEQSSTSVGVDFSISGPIKMFTASLGISVSHQTANFASKEVTISCGGFNQAKCTQGGQALIESRIQEGWVSLLNTDGKGAKDERNVPDWIGMDDDANNNGFRAPEKGTVDNNHYVLNPMYEGGWDLWETYGDSCTAQSSVMYAATNPAALER